MNKRIMGLLLVGLLLSACQEEVREEATVETAAQRFNWRMVTTWPVGFPVFQEGAERFAEDVGQMSNGRLQIRVYASGELVPALQVFDAVAQGTVEMGHGSAYYWAGKIPAAQFFSSVPFGMDAAELRNWLHSGGLELWRQLYAPFGVRPLSIGNTGMQMGGWFNRPVESLEDIQGLRMRIPGLGGKVLEMAGGNPVLLAGGEIYAALERGVIDATEWVGPFHDQRLGLQRVAQYYYYPGWHERGTELELLISTAAWESLPADLQRIVERTAAATRAWSLAEIDKQNRIALQELRQLSRVSIRAFPPEVLQKLRDYTRQALQAEAADDAQFAEVYRSYEEFRAGQQDWQVVTRLALPAGPP